MNAYLRLDHLIDKFKHDVREIIDSAVAEERASLMNKLEAFIDTDGKSTDEEIVQFVKDKVEEIKPEIIVDITASHEPLKALTEAIEEPVKPEPACEQCKTNPIGMNGYGSKKYCSKGGNRAIALAQAERHRKKALSR